MYSQARQDDFIIHMMNGKIGEYNRDVQKKTDLDFKNNN
jgi:hypothetical protein